MSFDDLLIKYSLETLLKASVQVDYLLVVLAENWILHDAGFVDAFGMMNTEEDLHNYVMLREYLFARGTVNPDELLMKALNLIRTGDYT